MLIADDQVRQRFGFRMLSEATPDTQVAAKRRTALRAGASGFLLKDSHPEELPTGIRGVARG